MADESRAHEVSAAHQNNEATANKPQADATKHQEATSADAAASLRADVEAMNKLERHLYAHRYAEKSFETYGMTIDPPKATADRGEALAILCEEDHDLLCSSRMGATLSRLTANASQLDPITRAQARVLKRAYDAQVNVDPNDDASLTRLLTESDGVWRRAKLSNDWASFEPYLDRIVTLMRRIAHERDPRRDAYDVWLDEYEPGSSCEFYDDFFAQVKDAVVPLLMDVRTKRAPSRACIEGRFDPNRQWLLAKDIAQLEGVDMDAYWLTATEHPFSEALTTHYAITAAHVHENDVMSNVFTMLHEGGHNLYEQGVNPAFNYTSLSGGSSAGMHEGQSRFFENYVGRDRAFAPTLLALLQRHFRGQMSRTTPQQLYLAVNRVEPQPLRMEADELTYPLHILVRYEIERMLFSGEATAKDVPGLWSQKYKSYLGVLVPDDTHGALQDSHWADGLMGYFPGYALGGAYGAQLRDQMIAEGLDWEGTLSSGDLAPIRDWLRDRIWQYGRSKDPAELIWGACHEHFDATHYTNYLQQKFSKLYNL
ncbi:MAG: carboxypeptidase M32 [Atopobiaceae bacterium]